MIQSKIIHVNRQFIAQNAKDGKNRPVYTMKEGRNGKPRYARSIKILGPSLLVADTEQLKCGARAWIETEAEVILEDEMTFLEVKENFK